MINQTQKKKELQLWEGKQEDILIMLGAQMTSL